MNKKTENKARENAPVAADITNENIDTTSVATAETTGLAAGSAVAVPSRNNFATRVTRISRKIKNNFLLNWRDYVFYFVLVIIPVVQFAIMYVAVNFNSILMSFQSYDKDTGVFSWAGLDNYKRFFTELGTNSLWKTMFLNSTIAFLVAQFITKSLAVFFSYYIYKKHFGYKVFRVILFIPSIISSVVTVAVFSQFIDGAFPGILNSWFGMTAQGGLANQETTFFWILFYNVWIAFGPSLLIYSSTMNDISPSVTEAAKIDGCKPFMEFFHIILPNIWPTYVVFTVATLASYFGNSLSIYAFYGSWADDRLYTFGYYLFRNAEIYKGSLEGYPYLSTIGVCFTAVLVPIVLGIRKLMLKLGPSTK